MSVVPDLIVSEGVKRVRGKESLEPELNALYQLSVFCRMVSHAM
jgi:hypothetical protein